MPARMGVVLIFSITFWIFSIGNSWDDVKERKQMLLRDYASIRNGGVGLGFTAKQQSRFGVANVLKYFETKGMYDAD